MLRLLCHVFQCFAPHCVLSWWLGFRLHVYMFTCSHCLYMLDHTLSLRVYNPKSAYVHAWVLLASVSSMLQHNEVMDIRSRPILCPLWTPYFVSFLACYLACLPSRSFAHILVSILAVYIMLICFMPFHILFASFPSITCLLVFCLCLCMYTHGARKNGVRARFPRCKQKGHKRNHVDISQATMFSRFSSLVFPIWLCTLLNPFPSSSLSPLDCLY